MRSVHKCNKKKQINLGYYDIFPEAQDILEKNKIKLHYLCSWWDILEETKLQKTFSADTIKEVESFLHSPREWQNERL